MRILIFLLLFKICISQEFKIEFLSYLKNKESFNEISARICNKFKFTLLDNLKFSLLVEKDPYEKDFFDLFKFSCSFKTKSLNLYLGNYKCYFKEGLVIYPPICQSKKHNPTNIQRKEEGIKEDNTVFYEDNAYFKGIAISKKISNTDCHFFYSKNKIDASKDKKNNIKEVYFDGTHSGYKEKYKDNLEEELFGARLYCKDLKNINFGICFYRAKYTPKLLPIGGDENKVIAFDFDYKFNKNLINFGQIAYRKNLNYILGIKYKTKKFTFGYLFRDIKDDFFNLHGFSFSRNPTKPASNEFGHYLGYRFKIKKLEFSGYIEDIKRNPQKTFYKESRIFEIGLSQKFKNKKFRIFCFENYKNTCAKFKLQEFNFSTTFKLNSPNLRIYTKLTKQQINQKYSQNGLLFDVSYLSKLTPWAKIRVGYTTSFIKKSKYPFLLKLSYFEYDSLGGYLKTLSKTTNSYYSILYLTIKNVNIGFKYKLPQKEYSFSIYNKYKSI